MTPLPNPPTPPLNLTLTTAVAYLSSLAVFVLGLLTFAGVTVPANISTEVQTWSAVALSVAGAATALWATINHHKTVVALAALKR